jgi:uncharacterized protein YyaL (SSP411 family)
MVELQKDNIIKYPNSYGVWASLLLAFVQGTNEVLILGPGAVDASFKFLEKYVPNSVLMASETVEKGYPLMEDKKEKELLTFYLCKSYSCRLPVLSEGELMKQITI